MMMVESKPIQDKARVNVYRWAIELGRPCMHVKFCSTFAEKSGVEYSVSGQIVYSLKLDICANIQ